MPQQRSTAFQRHQKKERGIKKMTKQTSYTKPPTHKQRRNATEALRNTPIEYIENFTKKGKFSDKKKTNIFHIPAQNIDCGTR